MDTPKVAIRHLFAIDRDHGGVDRIVVRIRGQLALNNFGHATVFPGCL
jgi:hypothetical protein